MESTSDCCDESFFFSNGKRRISIENHSSPGQNKKARTENEQETYIPRDSSVFLPSVDKRDGVPQYTEASSQGISTFEYSESPKDDTTMLFDTYGMQSVDNSFMEYCFANSIGNETIWNPGFNTSHSAHGALDYECAWPEIEQQFVSLEHESIYSQETPTDTTGYKNPPTNDIGQYIDSSSTLLFKTGQDSREPFFFLVLRHADKTQICKTAGNTPK
jgi:hypothetical protein